MGKILTSLGLMSGTSGDGVDASIIKSDGNLESNKEVIIEIIKDKFFEYDNTIAKKIHSIRNKINFFNDLKKFSSEIADLEREITLFHAKTSNEMMKNKKIDLIGFHGHTIYHSPEEKISKQLGDPHLLYQLTNKNIIFNFRDNDIKNGGEGAPLAPIYHFAIAKEKKIKLPLNFLNIGGISNITQFYDKNFNFRARDIGPGNCMIDKWIRENSKFNYDKDGELAKSGEINKLILEQVSEHRQTILERRSILEKQRSLDIKNYDISFVRGLSLEDGAATLTDYSASLLCDAILTYCYKVETKKESTNNMILSGGGRKNKFLIKKIKEKIGKYFKITMMDEYNINGDFVESQAFGFLAIRSFQKLPISFPETTGCKNPSVGGEIFKLN